MEKKAVTTTDGAVRIVTAVDYDPETGEVILIGPEGHARVAAGTVKSIGPAAALAPF